MDDVSTLTLIRGGGNKGPEAGEGAGLGASGASNNSDHVFGGTSEDGPEDAATGLERSGASGAELHLHGFSL